MNITIHITASGAKRLLFVGAVLIILGTAAVSFAVPVTFQSGTVLKAADLNQDFAAATTATNGTKTYSLGAVFKKATQSKYNGNLGGYAGAKAICESLLSSLTAHMCTSEELVRSYQLGMNVSSGGWYASGIASGTTMDDCRGWTDGTTSFTGPQWVGGQPYFSASTNCSTTADVLCCD